MAKHNARCKVCNKFVTNLDMLDDGMCFKCADALERAMLERTSTYHNMMMVLVVIIVVLVGLLLWATVANAQGVEYYVTGINVQTNERVVGWLDGQVGSGEVQGTVLDRGDRFVVVGQSDGKGSFVLKSLCCEYEVEVTNEVSESKLENRRALEEK